MRLSLRDIFDEEYRSYFLMCDSIIYSLQDSSFSSSFYPLIDKSVEMKNIEIEKLLRCSLARIVGLQESIDDCNQKSVESNDIKMSSDKENNGGLTSRNPIVTQREINVQITSEQISQFSRNTTTSLKNKIDFVYKKKIRELSERSNRLFSETEKIKSLQGETAHTLATIEKDINTFVDKAILLEFPLTSGEHHKNDNGNTVDTFTRQVTDIVSKNILNVISEELRSHHLRLEDKNQKMLLNISMKTPEVSIDEGKSPKIYNRGRHNATDTFQQQHNFNRRESPSRKHQGVNNAVVGSNMNKDADDLRKGLKERQPSQPPKVFSQLLRNPPTKTNQVNKSSDKPSGGTSVFDKNIGITRRGFVQGIRGRSVDRANMNQCETRGRGRTNSGEFVPEIQDGLIGELHDEIKRIRFESLNARADFLRQSREIYTRGYDDGICMGGRSSGIGECEVSIQTAGNRSVNPPTERVNVATTEEKVPVDTQISENHDSSIVLNINKHTDKLFHKFNKSKKMLKTLWSNDAISPSTDQIFDFLERIHRVCPGDKNSNHPPTSLDALGSVGEKIKNLTEVYEYEIKKITNKLPLIESVAKRNMMSERLDTTSTDFTEMDRVLGLAIKSYEEKFNEVFTYEGVIYRI